MDSLLNKNVRFTCSCPVRLDITGYVIREETDAGTGETLWYVQAEVFSRGQKTLKTVPVGSHMAKLKIKVLKKI
jgi:hypothetical protein